MYDQLRFDYLGVAGHPTLTTPHFDRVAAMGFGVQAVRGSMMSGARLRPGCAAGSSAGGTWSSANATPLCETLGVAPRDARLFMVFDARVKLMHAEGVFRPMLFHLQTEPEEFHDLAMGGAHDAEIARLCDHLAHWGRRMSQRVTRSDDEVKAMRRRSSRRRILPFLYDGSEVPDELTVKYRGPVPGRYVDEDGA